MALYVAGSPYRHTYIAYRWVTDYLCVFCGEDRKAVDSVLSRCPRVKYAIHQQFPPISECAECWRKNAQESACVFYCGRNECVGRCVSKTLAGTEIRTGPDYIWRLVDA